MFKRSKLSQAITLAIVSSAVGVSSNALAQEDESRRIEEIIVTATKRSESMQDIPVAVQALTAEALQNLDINNFADYVEQLPNVNFSGRGPGQNDVFIRGLSTGRGSLFQAGGIGAGPTVAFYVDEAPLTAAGRNVDVYVTDIDRVEVLPGPQGTLYGASSQGGTVRLITNKPDLSGFSSGIELSLSATQDGAPSWGVEGFVNIPIIEDKFAVRIAAYDVTSGGYIDNVAGTYSFAANQSLVAAPGAELRVASNDALVEDDINESEYVGARVSATLAINDDWDLNVGYMTQELRADGVFDYAPELGDLQVQRFTPDYLDDKFDQFNWTLEGRLGWLDVIYTGSYLERDIEQRIDYVGVTQKSWQPWYNCTYNGLGEVTVCAAPDQNYHGIEKSDNTQHELRISTDASKALSFIGGVFIDSFDGGVSQEWEYHGGNQVVGLDFAPNAPHSAATHFDPSTRNPEVAFFNDLSPHAEQKAIFGELTYAFSDAWSTTFGLRRYDLDVSVKGSFNWATMGLVDADSGGSLDAFQPSNRKDTIPKVTLTYTPNDDVLLYATYSEGYRRGGFNRGGEVFFVQTGELAFPASYNSDTIKNNEFGWKTTLMDGRLRFNGAAYFIDWSDLQLDIFDPPTYGLLLFTANVGEAEVKGVEGDFTFLATDSLTLSGAFSFNDSELTYVPVGVDVSPVGSDLALSAKFQGNVNARYDFNLSGRDAYAQLGLTHRGSTVTSIVADIQPLDAYTLANASFGVNINEWNVKVFVSNLANDRSDLFISCQDGPCRTVTSRPRTLSLKLSRDF